VPPVWTRPQRTLRLTQGRTHVELSGADLDGSDRVAVLVHHGAVPAVTRSFRELVAAFDQRGYGVLVVSSSEFREPLDWGDTPPPASVTVLRKPNVGYDFGSWAVGLDAFAAVRRSPTVVLANDSLVGPFASLDPVLDRMERTTADVWGLTETLQFARHLQSYFVAYRGGVLADAPLEWFWRGVRHHSDKQTIIHRNEIGLGRLLEREGYAIDALFGAGQVVPAADNPTIAGWRTLLERGLPFVKREIVRSPGLAPQGEQIPDELRARYGVDVAQWLDR
jgi:hypothetical protein